ncbi:MAG: N-acetylglucosamine-6-phosphate deacetylase [Clostridia bacterium]|nr:N-acetylglucosamine-6-phosphate deacetylase [Clostridia bacterium]
MKGIRNGKVILPDGIVEDKVLVFDSSVKGLYSEEEAATLCDEIYDAEGKYVSPGFVDVHIHAYGGKDVSDGVAEDIKAMAGQILKNGVTAFCPTTMTVSIPEITAAFDACRSLKEESKTWNGAEIIGVHAEGPFINKAKKGAQNEAHILPPNAEFVLENKDILSIMTIAPEVDGMEDFIRTVTENSDVVLSVGHTCANYDETKKSIEWGVTHSTHTFNAMVGLLHRDPGTVGAVLSSDKVYCELISDTFHVHPGLYQMLYNLKKDHLVVITDCIRAAGMPEGEYVSGGLKFTVKGIECRLPDGTIAGSVLRMNHAVKNFLNHTDLPLYEVINLLSRNPAASVHAHNKGTLEIGKDADILFLDDQFEVVSVFRMGEKKF